MGNKGTNGSEAKNNLTREEAQKRAKVVFDVTYDVAIDLTGGSEEFGCVTTIRFKGKPGSSTFLDYLAPSVSSIQFNGKDIGSEAFDGTRIHIADLAETNEVKIISTSAYSTSGAGLHRFVDPVDEGVYLHSQFEPFDAHRVFPCFDQPDIKATFDFSVEAPAAWEVISNMKPTSRPGSGAAGTWVFETTPKVSTYITVFVAGPYQSFTDSHGQIDLALYCRGSLAKYLEPDVEEIFEITKQGFDYFEKVFGYPYVFGKYDQLFVPEFNAGAMENAGAITFNEGYVFRSKVTDAARARRAGTILHEMAHMWFGDLVTMRWWDDLWLNESFATFAAYDSMAKATRFRNAWTLFANGAKSFAYRADQLPSTHPIYADIPDIKTALTNFDGITYAKGASVLRQLVAWVGEKEFFEGVANYFKAHEYSNTELKDFLGALEETSGRDLREWSKEWLEKAGVNTMRAEYDDSDGTLKDLSLKQSAQDDWPTLRRHRIGVGLYDSVEGKLKLRVRDELDAEGADTPVEKLLGELKPALLLLNDGDLAYTKIELDSNSLATVTADLKNLDDSLARGLCWAACWEMVRDAQMRARDFLDLVINNIEGETEIAIVQLRLSQAVGAIANYGDPKNRDPARNKFAQFTLAQLRGAQPASDLQLAYAGEFVSASKSGDHLRILEALLDGSATFEGLTIDTDMRWRIVTALVRHGSAGEELISAELERDGTDAGQRLAATARAAIPSLEAKTEAFRQVTEDEELHLAKMRAILGGFHSYDRSDLNEAFVDQYFEWTPKMWANRSQEVAQTFTTSAFPSTVIGESLINKVDAYLKNSDPSFPVRRILSEKRDDVARAIRARDFDAS